MDAVGIEGNQNKKTRLMVCFLLAQRTGVPCKLFAANNTDFTGSGRSGIQVVWCPRFVHGALTPNLPTYECNHPTRTDCSSRTQSAGTRIQSSQAHPPGRGRWIHPPGFALSAP